MEGCHGKAASACWGQETWEPPSPYSCKETGTNHKGKAYLLTDSALLSLPSVGLSTHVNAHHSTQKPEGTTESFTLYNTGSKTQRPLSMDF